MASRESCGHRLRFVASCCNAVCHGCAIDRSHASFGVRVLDQGEGSYEERAEHANLRRNREERNYLPITASRPVRCSTMGMPAATARAPGGGAVGDVGRCEAKVSIERVLCL